MFPSFARRPARRRAQQQATARLRRAESGRQALGNSHAKIFFTPFRAKNFGIRLREGLSIVLSPIRTLQGLARRASPKQEAPPQVGDVFCPKDFFSDSLIGE